MVEAALSLLANILNTGIPARVEGCKANFKGKEHGLLEPCILTVLPSLRVDSVSTGSLVTAVLMGRRAAFPVRWGRG